MDDVRAVQHCARYDLPVVEWEDGEAVAAYCGRHELPEGSRPDWHAPFEEEDEGCPGAWYRSIFAESLEVYLPTPCGDQMMDSPLLREAPRLVIEAVQYWKRERARSSARYWEISSG